MKAKLIAYAPDTRTADLEQYLPEEPARAEITRQPGLAGGERWHIEIYEEAVTVSYTEIESMAGRGRVTISGLLGGLLGTGNGPYGNVTVSVPAGYVEEIDELLGGLIDPDVHGLDQGPLGPGTDGRADVLVYRDDGMRPRRRVWRDGDDMLPEAYRAVRDGLLDVSTSLMEARASGSETPEAQLPELSPTGGSGLWSWIADR
jgi:hypothetical protein